MLTNRFDAEYGRAGGAVIGGDEDRHESAPRHRLRVSARRQDRRAELVANACRRSTNRRSASPSAARSSAIARTSSAATSVRRAIIDVADRHPAVRRESPGRSVTCSRAAATCSWDRSIARSRAVRTTTSISRPGRRRPRRPLERLQLSRYNTDLSVGETWVIRDRLVNEIRTGFSYIDNALISNSPRRRATASPRRSIGSPTNSPQWWKEMNIQFNNSLSYFVPNWHGEHSLQRGLPVLAPEVLGRAAAAVVRRVQFRSRSDGLQRSGDVSARRRRIRDLGDFTYSAANPTYAAFVQDNWTITPKLYAELGVRYDVESSVKNTDFAESGRARRARVGRRQLRAARRLRLRRARRRPHGGARRHRPLLRQGAAEHPDERGAQGNGPVR